MNVQWDEKFEIGHSRIDFEHRIFLGLIKDLDQAVNEKRSRDKIRRILEELRLYAQFHFVSEENIMIDCGFPELERHREEHKTLLALLGDRAKAFLLDESDTGAKIVDFSFSWFALHTTQEDKKIADYVRRHGDAG